MYRIKKVIEEMSAILIASIFFTLTSNEIKNKRISKAIIIRKDFLLKSHSILNIKMNTVLSPNAKRKYVILVWCLGFRFPPTVFFSSLYLIFVSIMNQSPFPKEALL